MVFMLPYRFRQYRVTRNTENSPIADIFPPQIIIIIYNIVFYSKIELFIPKINSIFKYL